jgi:glycerol-3-phosphate acyltransferase PlsY
VTIVPYGVFVALWCYLLGSIPTGYWVVKAVKDVDIRSFGSGNIGMTNVWRVAGAGWGLATLLLDILKGVLAVWLGGSYFNSDGLRIVAVIAVLMGNLFPLFLKFKGGKGVGTSVGVFFSLVPLESAIGAVVFFLVIGRWKMVSAASLAAVTAMALAVAHRSGIVWPISQLALAGCLLVWWSHRENIVRILQGAENKIGKPKPVTLSPDAPHAGTAPDKPGEAP